MNWGALLLGLVGGAAAAQTTVRFRDGASPTPAYAGTRDVLLSEAYVFEGRDLPDVNYDTTLSDVDGHITHRSVLLRFDLSSVAPGTRVQAAELHVTVYGTDQTGDSYFLYPSLRPWVASEATFRQYRLGQPWGYVGAAAVGVDRSAIETGAVTGGPGTLTVALNPAGVTLVEGWIAAPSTNLGWIIQNYAADNGLAWHNCDDSTLASRTRLRLTVTTDAGTQLLDFQNGVAPTVAYSGCADTTIGMGGPRDGGALNALDLGLEGDLGNGETALLSFDLSSLGSSAVVEQARLLLWAENRNSRTYHVYAARRPWTEWAATWSRYDELNAWQDAGAYGAGDRDLVPLVSFSGRDAGAHVLDLSDAGVALVQSWLAGAPNHGFVLSPTYGANGQLELSDREVAEVSQRPGLELVVSFPDGGTTDGGTTDGGTSDGGTTDGGTSDGGTSDGGTSDGGTSDGGTSDGGTSDGGTSDGGTSDGGTSDGGTSDGGTSDGGTSDGGTSDTELRRRDLTVGCDCAQVSLEPALLGALLLLRRRHLRRHGD